MSETTRCVTRRERPDQPCSYRVRKDPVQYCSRRACSVRDVRRGDVRDRLLRRLELVWRRGESGVGELVSELSVR